MTSAGRDTTGFSNGQTRWSRVPGIRFSETSIYPVSDNRVICEMDGRQQSVYFGTRVRQRVCLALMLTVLLAWQAVA